jgi:hypothetical protein
MHWSNADKNDAYDEEHALNDYISRNLWDLVGRSVATAYYLARKIEHTRENDEWAKVYQEILAEQPFDVADAVAIGSDMIVEQVKNRIRKGQLCVNRCPKCNRIVRTRLARQCLWCGHDWHEK